MENKKDTKQQLLYYLESYKDRMNMYDSDKNKIDKIELFSGVKPASYYFPDLLEYLHYTPLFEKGVKRQMAWFVEIWINDVCVWRKSKMNETGEGLQQFEEELIADLMSEIVMVGLNSSWLTTIDLLVKKI